MERQRRAAYSGTSYPDIREALDRRSVLKGLGCAAGALAVSTTAGCLGRVAGLTIEPGEDTYQASLPPAPDVRTLYFDYEGTIDYHVIAVVTNYDLFLYLEDECANLLGAIDDVLATHTIYDFQPGSDLSVIVTEITQTLADAYAGTLGAPTDEFVQVEFVVDYYNEEIQIDGDVGEPE